MKVTIDNIAHQTLSMAFDGIKKCEFVFDGDEVEILDPNGVHFEDEDEALNYLSILMKNANMTMQVVDADDDQIEFRVGQAE
jgi:hypothetical protein